MELKTWLICIRILNFASAGMLIGFEIWFIIRLLSIHTAFYEFILQIPAPALFIMLSLIIIASDFKYQMVQENFKFLQSLPGLAIFNLFIASIVAMQYSQFNDTTAVIVASMFVLLSIFFGILSCFKPESSKGYILSA